MNFINISCFISKNILLKVILQNHVSVLASPSCTSQNPFQSNKSCESIGIFKNIYLLVFAFFRECLFWNHSILHVGTMKVSFRGTYWLSCAYFILLPVCFFYFSLFSFFSFFVFCGVFYLLSYWGKLVNSLNKAVELFLGSWMQFGGGGCFSL